MQLAIILQNLTNMIFAAIKLTTSHSPNRRKTKKTWQPITSSTTIHLQLPMSKSISLEIIPVHKQIILCTILVRAWVIDMHQSSPQLKPWCSCKNNPLAMTSLSWAAANNSSHRISQSVKNRKQNKPYSDRLHWQGDSFWLSIHMLRTGNTIGHCQTHTVLIIWDLPYRIQTKINFWDPQRLIIRLYSRTRPLKSLSCQ